MSGNDDDPVISRGSAVDSGDLPEKARYYGKSFAARSQSYDRVLTPGVLEFCDGNVLLQSLWSILLGDLRSRTYR